MSSTIEQFDLVIIGAGPAGMAAAIEGADHGATVALIDEQTSPGGQIYRNVSNAPPGRKAVLGKDYSAGAALAQRLLDSAVQHRFGATVWHVGTGGEVTYSAQGTATRINGRQVILATGAIERAMPIPGWTLPGVMTAGAAQIMLKANGLIARDAVLVGSGPLLYLLAVQMCQAGAPPKALIETQSFADLRAASTHAMGMLRGWRQIAKGLGLLARLRRYGVKRFTGARGISVLGESAAEAVEFTTQGKPRRIEAQHVFLHQGVIPNTQISRALRLDHHFNAAQRCFCPTVDAHGQSSNPRFSIAGDGAAIEGAVAAQISGRIAALNGLSQIGLIDPQTRDANTAPLLRERARETAARAFLDRAYAPPADLFAPDDATLICRCEEITAGEIRAFARLGCTGPNQLKAFGRVGMGPCQGRSCGHMAAEILAREHQQNMDQTGYFNIRAPLKPVTLGELAALDATTD